MTVHSFFTVHMPCCTVQVLVLKKKKKSSKRANLSKRGRECGSKSTLSDQKV